jgi:hypothetical protein
MMIREFEQGDIPQLERLWAEKGFECRQPDFSRMGGMVLVDEAGVIREAALDRITTEIYFLMDRSAWETPGMKWTQFERLHEAERRSLEQRGFEDVHAWVPRAWRSFARRLKRVFGWVNSNGPDGSWCGLTRDV